MTVMLTDIVIISMLQAKVLTDFINKFLIK